MKKVLSLLIAAAILITSFVAVHCEDDIRVTLDGKDIAFDVLPQIINDRVLVPMRAIFEALGAQVEWRESGQNIVAYRDETEIIMSIGNNTMKKHYWPHGDYSSLDTISEWKSYESSSIYTELDVSPMIIDNRTLVPIRAVAEGLDCDVQWDGENRAVVITSAEPVAKPTVEPTVEPTAEPAPNPIEVNIEYDDTSERKAHYARHFKLISAKKTSEGYKITYSVRTFLEGRGTVGVTFNCYDSSGNIVDTFGGMFIGTDYTWSEHEAEAVISDKTVKIELRLEN